MLTYKAFIKKKKRYDSFTSKKVNVMLKNMQSDNYHRTGCFNIRCPGFVQTHRGSYIGSRETNISFYGGPIFGFYSSITQVTLLV